MDEEKEVRDLVAAGISMAIDDFLKNRVWMLDWMLDDTMAWAVLNQDANIILNEVVTRMAEYSTHLRANYCEDILYEWETQNDGKNRSADKGQGNSGESGERHDADSTTSDIIEEIAKDQKELREGL